MASKRGKSTVLREKYTFFIHQFTTFLNLFDIFTEQKGQNKVVKGLVHPKMKIKSLITHPHAVPTP